MKYALRYVSTARYSALELEWVEEDSETTGKEPGLKEQGYVLLNRNKHIHFPEAKKAVKQILNYFVSNYNEYADEFEDIDTEELGIVRYPRIGAGKHNIHFDIHDTIGIHNALKKVASQMIACVHEKKFELREYGLSITRPYSQIHQKHGEGIEWHSDGGKGEHTMIVAMEDIPKRMGALKVLPGSHQVYVDGRGHGEVSPAALYPA